MKFTYILGPTKYRRHLVGFWILCQDKFKRSNWPTDSWVPTPLTSYTPRFFIRLHCLHTKVVTLWGCLFIMLSGFWILRGWECYNWAPQKISKSKIHILTISGYGTFCKDTMYNIPIIWPPTYAHFAENSRIESRLRDIILKLFRYAMFQSEVFNSWQCSVKRF